MTNQNHSIVAYTDKTSKEEILKGLQEMDLGEVIVNGISLNDTLNGRPVQMFTFIKIDKEAWRKVKGRKFFRTLKTEGSVKNTR